ncbi:hypothetical protein Gohar_000477, partial [Gossypium harknessii]|nr:hypothetical protein [Gossypium harknessii]
VQAEADEYGGGKSGGQISLVSTVGEGNDSGFGSSVGDERVDNVATAVNGEEEDGNETEVWDLNEHGNLVGSNEDEEHEDECRRQLKFLKNEPKKGCCEVHCFP